MQVLLNLSESQGFFPNFIIEKDLFGWHYATKLKILKHNKPRNKFYIIHTNIIIWNSPIILSFLDHDNFNEI